MYKKSFGETFAIQNEICSTIHIDCQKSMLPVNQKRRTLSESLG